MVAHRKFGEAKASPRASLTLAEISGNRCMVGARDHVEERHIQRAKKAWTPQPSRPSFFAFQRSANG